MSENIQNDSRANSAGQRQNKGTRPNAPAHKKTGCSSRCVGRQGVPISYKEVKLLENYMMRGGKIRPRRQTGNCARHQRQLAQAIKRARYMALLPFAPSHKFTSNQ